MTALVVVITVIVVAASLGRLFRWAREKDMADLAARRQRCAGTTDPRIIAAHAGSALDAVDREIAAGDPSEPSMYRAARALAFAGGNLRLLAVYNRDEVRAVRQLDALIFLALQDPAAFLRGELGRDARLAGARKVLDAVNKDLTIS